jgi:hypothetical protein
MIFLSLFIISAVLIGASFALNANEPNGVASPQPSQSQSANPSESDAEEGEASEEGSNSEGSAADLNLGDYKVEPGNSVPILAVLYELELKEEEESSSYDRGKFRHWINVEGKCSAREYVLREESLVEVGYTDREECKVSTGKWLSLYDDVTLSNASEVDIDHVVPLKEAWESGAHNWNAGKRRAFANDIGFDRSLIAVSAKSNRSKSDRDPAEWLPPSKAYLCTYIADWVAVKYRWKLSVDSAEKKAIESSAKDCDNLVTLPSRG